MEDRIQAVAADLGGRLTGVETAVTLLIDRADGTDRRLDGIDGRLDRLEGRQAGLEARQAGLEGRFDRLEAWMNAREQVIVRTNGGPVPAGGAGRRPGEADRLWARLPLPGRLVCGPRGSAARQRLALDGVLERLLLQPVLNHDYCRPSMG